MACALLLPASLAASESSPAAVEDKIKAVYIYNFIRFTEWPEATRSQEVNLSILGNLSLLKTFKGEPFKESRHGLKLNVRTCTMPGCIQESHVLFIDRSEQAQVNKILHQLGNRPVLTISDLPGFVEQGGMIELRRRGERVTFRINLDAIKRTPLYVSAQLLQLAEIVERKP